MPFFPLKVKLSADLSMSTFVKNSISAKVCFAKTFGTWHQVAIYITIVKWSFIRKAKLLLKISNLFWVLNLTATLTLPNLSYYPRPIDWYRRTR